MKILNYLKNNYNTSLKIVDVEEGTGRNKGRLGAIVCKYYNNTVKVGSGFSDEQRVALWKNREYIIGKIVDIKYNANENDVINLIKFNPKKAVLFIDEQGDIKHN